MRKICLQCETKNLDEYRRLSEFAAEIGVTHVNVGEVEPSLWQWDRNRYDPYPNWGMYHPTLFKFIVPDVLKQYLPVEYAKRNLENLIARVEILREFGLKAAFSGMEPGWLPEEVYQDHPEWRGARCDQPRRARAEYYAPCVDQPEVRKFYTDTVAELCSYAPIEYFHLMTNDSGGGLCWSEGLYPGKNGPMWCQDRPIGERIASFLSIFQEGAERAGLHDVEVNVRHIAENDETAARPLLRRNQSINAHTKDGSAAFVWIGFPRGETDDHTFPVRLLPRMEYYAEGVQNAQENPENNHFISLRSTEDVETISFLRRFYGKIGKGPLGRTRAITELAASFVGEENADDLAEIWHLIEQGVSRLDYLQTGGHIFMLGTVHQRWLTRPLVAFPEELTKEEKAYYRDYQFQAQSEEDADNLLDLQAHRWIGGYSGQFLISRTAACTLPLFQRAAEKATRLYQVLLEDRSYRESIRLLILRIRLYLCVIRNAENVCEFQTILDRTDRSEAPRDRSPVLWEQGDARMVKINAVVRREIDNTLEIITLLKEGGACELLLCAPSEEQETIMRFGPAILEDLKKKIQIMEKHRRDFTRLYKPLNR